MLIGGDAIRQSDSQAAIKLVEKWKSGKRGYHESSQFLTRINEVKANVKRVASHPGDRGPVDEFEDEEMDIFLADRVADGDYHQLFSLDGTFTVIEEWKILELLTEGSYFDIIDDSGSFLGDPFQDHQDAKLKDYVKRRDLQRYLDRFGGVKRL